MNALSLYYKYAKIRTLLAVSFGTVSGGMYAFLIPIVMAFTRLNEKNATQNADIIGLSINKEYLGFIFFSLCILIILFRSSSGALLSRIAIDIRFYLRRDLYSLINNTSIADLENVGEARLIQALSTDVAAIVSGAQVFPALLMNSVTLVGLLAYLAYMDVGAFLFIVKLILIGITTYLVPVRLARKYFFQAREYYDDLQQSLKGLVCGAKELKLNNKKRESFQKEQLILQENELRRLEKTGFTIHQLSENYGDLLCFFAVGIITFTGLGFDRIPNEIVVPVIMVLLYISAPISAILNSLRVLTTTQVSLQKIETLKNDLPIEAEKPFPTSEKSINRDWHTIELNDVSYSYANNNTITKKFSVGPISIKIKRGEIVFITGGNGAGKSTLAKLISQHYLPTNGKLFLDDTEINLTNITEVREIISCIYSDFYLFEKLHGMALTNADYLSELNNYFKLLRLEDKVKITENGFSTLKLSDGQRRRLALIVALLEDRAIYVFDEWAADQDPEFKHIFYNEILKDLKAKGKTVIVISHDDRYFSVADNMIILESGMTINTTNKPITRNFQLGEC